MIDKRRKAIEAFGAFVLAFARDLNHLSDAGWSILVEGKRDEDALRSLGFTGGMATISAVASKGTRAFAGRRKVIILTDLDREGAVLAARHYKALSHEGFMVSLAERRRLKQASKGVFLHIENLSRFGEGGQG